MDEDRWYSVAEVAEMLAIKPDAVRKKARPHLSGEGSSDHVRRVSAGDDGGHRRIQIEAGLVEQWRERSGKKNLKPTKDRVLNDPSEQLDTDTQIVVGPDRSPTDHLRAENEMLTQSVRQGQIVIEELELRRRDEQLAAQMQLHQLEMATKDDRIVELEAEVDELRSMLVKALAKFGRSD